MKAKRPVRRISRVELSVDSALVDLVMQLRADIAELARQSNADRQVIFALLKRSSKRGRIGGRAVTQADLDACIAAAEERSWQ